MSTLYISRSHSTVCEVFAVKPRNSAKRDANQLASVSSEKTGVRKVEICEVLPEERFPDPFSTMDTHALQMIVRGAVDNAKERVRRNYKAAVPQFHRGKVQLLLPLCLSDPRVADLAILLARHEGVYRAATCLTLDMAYNARLLARPDRDWLQPWGRTRAIINLASTHISRVEGNRIPGGQSGKIPKSDSASFVGRGAL